MSKLDMVNIRQGTDSTTDFSQGNTLPYTIVPFGMNAFAPMTADDPCFFQPYSHRIHGIRLTHQPSPWIRDYGQLLFMPQCGDYIPDQWARAASYRLNEAVLRPDYISVNFMRYGANFELTPSDRGAAIRLKYDGRDIPRLCLFSFDYETEFVLNYEKREITGYTRALQFGGDRDKFAKYFVLQFEDDIDLENTRVSVDGQVSNGTEVKGNKVGISVAFFANEVNAKFATSFISLEQARINLNSEVSGKTFDEVRNNAIALWEERLNAITVEGKDEEQLRTFYTCLYRAHTFPHKFYEIAEDGSIWHYSPMDGKVKEGVSYVANGFWDTSRTCYPMYSVICPDDFAEMLEGFVNIYEDNGWLPKWLGPGEIGAMPGTLIDAVIADAAVRGIGKREVLEKALEGMIKHAEEKASMPFYGRNGIDEYKKYGYVPCDSHGESVNHTLDYAYGDFCIARVAEALGKTDIVEKYDKRSQNYRNLFDKERGFMVGKDKNGNFREDFDEFAWGRDYCEAGAWQGTWAVFHDVEGLAELMGGKDVAIEKLEKLHTMEPIFKTGGYGHEIHEMSEMAAVDFGQCAISNQPSFHIPYITAVLGKPSVTQKVVRRMTSELFSSGPQGFPGDEDNGSMSCWYLFSALGFYPFCSGTGEYVLGAPLFDKAVINLPNGKTFTVIAKNNDPSKYYVKEIYLNGEKYDKTHISHDDLMNGGELVFVF